MTRKTKRRLKQTQSGDPADRPIRSQIQVPTRHGCGIKHLRTQIQHSAFLVAATCKWPVLMIKPRPPRKRKGEDEPEHQWGPGHRRASETSTHSEEQPGNLNLSGFTTGTSFPMRPFFFFFLNTVKLREMERSRQRKFHPLGLNTGSQVGPWSTRRVGVGGCTQDVAAAATAAAVAECWQ